MLFSISWCSDFIRLTWTRSGENHSQTALPHFPKTKYWRTEKHLKNVKENNVQNYKYIVIFIFLGTAVTLLFNDFIVHVSRIHIEIKWFYMLDVFLAFLISILKIFKSLQNCLHRVTNITSFGKRLGSTLNFCPKFGAVSFHEYVPEWIIHQVFYGDPVN